MMRHAFLFEPNLADGVHCIPCSLGMMIEGTTGERVPFAKLEEASGYEPGKEPWAFGSMLALANRGLCVKAVERFDPDLFVRDPRAAIAKQADDASIVDRVFEVSNVEAQIDVVRACLAHPLVTFETRVPTMGDLVDELTHGADLLVNVNSKALNGKEGYTGHLVVVHDLDGDHLVVEDPGPPPQSGRRVTLGEFESAWKSPTEGMANFISVRG